MFKKMKPEDFKVGRRYRTNHASFASYVYTCMSGYGYPKALVREGGWRKPENNWEWEEVSTKKKKFL